jgi:hypothetical protein
LQATNNHEGKVHADQLHFNNLSSSFGMMINERSVVSVNDR